jgi:hypothetical protein
MRNIIALALLLAIFLNGCGGGSSGDVGEDNSTTIDLSQTFSLAVFNPTASSTVFAANLTGEDVNGVKYSGRVSIANLAQTMLEGVLVTPREVYIELVGGGIRDSTTTLSYIDTAGLLIAFASPSSSPQPSGLICTPVSPDAFPEEVRVGDSGVLSTLTCNNNTTITREWSTGYRGPGRIHLQISSEAKSYLGETISSDDVVYMLDSSGTIIGFAGIAYSQPTGFWLKYRDPQI